MHLASLGIEDLSEVPELTGAAVEAAGREPGAGCLIDRVEPGRPLIVSFGAALGEALPPFDFFARTKKLERRYDAPFNRILVRDLAGAWFHRGVPGLGSHVDEVAATLRALVRSVRPGRVVTIGQSMGAYAAVLFGMLLGADRIVAFGTTSTLDPERARALGDLRGVPAMEALRADPPRSGYDDLPALGEALGYRGELDLVFGTHPGRDDGVSTCLDAVHALRLARLANVALFPHPESGHPVVPWLARQGRIDDLLARLLLADVAG